jgi:alcohol dehydrogenase (NADP+)
MPANIGYAAPDAQSPLAPMGFNRPAVGPEDVRIEIKFCGVCHSDVHQVRDDFDSSLATNFPCMPGHEIVGIVDEVGAEVTSHAVGDRVGVGCLIYWGDESQKGSVDEQYQDPQAIFTYNSKDPRTGDITYGGYSDHIVVDQHFVLRIPDALPLEKAAPLLCAGVTTWSPLRHWDIGAGHTVAVAGTGGLGHIAIKLAKARGADQVIALTTSPDKRDGLLELGADEVIVMSDADHLKERASSIDFILSTIPTAFDMKPYVSLLRHDGALVSVGMLEATQAEAINFAEVAVKRVTIAGSFIGSIAETQEVLDFSAEHHVDPEIRIIDAESINDAFDDIADNDVAFRYVIDNSTLPLSGN